MRGCWPTAAAALSPTHPSVFRFHPPCPLHSTMAFRFARALYASAPNAAGACAHTEAPRIASQSHAEGSSSSSMRCSPAPLSACFASCVGAAKQTHFAKNWLSDSAVRTRQMQLQQQLLYGAKQKEMHSHAQRLASPRLCSAAFFRVLCVSRRTPLWS